MALIAPGPLGIVSGKLGSIEFTRGRASSIVRRGKTSVHRRSPAILAAQACLSAQRAAWQGLDIFTRMSWNTAAASITRTNRLGVQRPISGYALFMTQAPLAAHMGYSYIDSPPLAPAFEIPLDLALDADLATDFTASFQYPFYPAFFYTLWYGCRSAPISISSPPKRWTQLGWIDTSDNSQVITTLFSAALGTPAPGEYIAVTCSLWAKSVVHSPRAWCLAQVY